MTKIQTNKLQVAHQYVVGDTQLHVVVTAPNIGGGYVADFGLAENVLAEANASLFAKLQPKYWAAYMSHTSSSTNAITLHPTQLDAYEAVCDFFEIEYRDRDVEHLAWRLEEAQPGDWYVAEVEIP